MSTSRIPGAKEPRRISPWAAYVLFAAIWGLVPWLLSLLSTRYGWVAGRPGIGNGFGLIPVIAGTAGSVWTLFLHFGESRGGLDFEPDKSYLLRRGAYAFSRNPMYLSELTLLFGWVIFYGSLAVFVLFLAWTAWFSLVQVPQEERSIEARFGDAYREYKRRVPRWLGRIRD